VGYNVQKIFRITEVDSDVGCAIQKMGACLPKNGKRKATQTVDATRAVLSIIEHDVSFIKPSGRSSSKLRANGFNNKAYLVVIKDEAIPQRVRIIQIMALKSKCYPRKLKFRGFDDKDTW